MTLLSLNDAVFIILKFFFSAYRHIRNRGEANNTHQHTAQGDEKKLSTACRTFRSVHI